MSFAHPTWLGGLWLVLLALGLAAYAQRRRRRVLQRYCAAPTRPRILHGAAPRRRWAAVALLAMSVGLLVVSLAGPRYGYRWQTNQRRGVDLLVAVDCSRSMLAQDVKPSRLGRAKREVLDLLRKLEGDRIGLVAFAGTAFLQCPLTLDYAGLNLFLRALEPDYLPLGGTALAEAIRTGLASFDPESPADKALVLITDGEATSGEAQAAAEEAREQGVQLYIIGVGTPEGAPIPARAGGFVKDADGTIVLARLGEKALQRLAASTGGTYVRSVAGDQDLDAVYGRIRSELEVKTLESRKVRVWEERYQWPLALAALALAVELALPLGTTVARVLLCVALLGAGSLGGATSARAAGAGAEVRAGVERYRAEDYAGATEAFTRAQVADPAAPQAAYNLGSAQYQSEAYEQAYGSFSAALQDAPPELRGRVLYNRGNTAFRLGRLEDAVTDYRAALEQQPELEDARFNLVYTRKVLAEQQAREEQQSSDQQTGDSDEAGEQSQPPDPQAGDSEEAGEQSPASSQPGGEGGGDSGQKPPGQSDGSSLASSAPDPGPPPGAGEDNPGQPSPSTAVSPAGDAAAEGEAAAQRARSVLNRLDDQPGRALMPRYRKRQVEKDW